MPGNAMKPTEGFATYKKDGGTFQTWYKAWGELENPKYPPLIIIHGGPGIPSAQHAPFSILTKDYSIPVVIYDQIGAGNSTKLPDKPASFWSLDHFMDEFENLVDHLKITNFSILGHSWGAMLGAWYAGTRQPKGLRNLILADGIARMEDWVESTKELLSRLDPAVQKDINDYEYDDVIPTKEYQDAIGLHRNGMDDKVDEKYKDAVKKYDIHQKAVVVFMQNFTCRKDPLPGPLLQSLHDMGPYPNVNDKMWGPLWLRCIKPWSPLGDFDCVHLLPKVKARTLVYHGEYDQAQDFVVKPFVENIPGAKQITFRNVSHLPHLEDNGETYKAVGDFLIDK